MSIYIENKRRKIDSIKEQYPGVDKEDILDLTSKSKYAQILSPFYPHGNIPIPFSGRCTATCVEAVWQGLKVFENCGVDKETFHNATMKNLKRTVRKYGPPRGHQKGLYSNELLDYFQARILIYLPTYEWMLENVDSVISLVKRISQRAKEKDLVFLDYNTNYDYKDTSSPLSHAGLLKLYIEGKYPHPTENDHPYTSEEIAAIKTKRKAKKKNVKSKKKKENNTQQLSLFEQSQISGDSEINGVKLQ
mgnify:CR=1 FL=1